VKSLGALRYTWLRHHPAEPEISLHFLQNKTKLNTSGTTATRKKTNTKTKTKTKLYNYLQLWHTDPARIGVQQSVMAL
jgi:hypothetical protein